MTLLSIALSLLTTPHAAAETVNLRSGCTDSTVGGYCTGPSLGGICMAFIYNDTNPDQCQNVNTGEVPAIKSLKIFDGYRCYLYTGQW
ncbi:hypothetical protein PG984_011859 [Apiospora sp. TS-2023a]